MPPDLSPHECARPALVFQFSLLREPPVHDRLTVILFLVQLLRRLVSGEVDCRVRTAVVEEVGAAEVD